MSSGAYVEEKKRRRSKPSRRNEEVYKHDASLLAARVDEWSFVMLDQSNHEGPRFHRAPRTRPE
ncbi:unnamed protein product [Sphenostylis stenocarpa]|uniref:Uncharacterized protein n=1 Tax=Sphenostylis stenocarpa TaxID=92480 RepID=A0AA86RY80_9FABA|nr:unnamed protein product [Sphenostylis stenocarpa]